MNETLLLRYCSPTLAGLKSGNMFSYFKRGDSSLEGEIASWNAVLEKKGVRMLLLQENGDRALILVYRPEMVERCTEQCEVKQFLRTLGYPSCFTQGTMQHLQTRMQNGEEFPHEIGLFLGYPFEDVCSFIDNKGCNGVCDGCWKVYKDVSSAQKTFDRFKKCTTVYLEQHAKGKPLQDLVVQRIHI